MLNQIKRLLCAGAVAMCVPAPAFSDVSAFNAAVRAGDYKSAAAAAKEIWGAWDKSDPQTAVIAREFGFASLVGGDTASAREFGEFLVTQGASLATPDNTPHISNVLFRAASYKEAPSTARLVELRNALTTRAVEPGIDMVSVTSWEMLYVSAWSANDLASAEADATAAAEFLAREPKYFLPRQRSAEVTAAAAAFLRVRDAVADGKKRPYDAMVEVHDAIVSDINAAESASSRAELWPAKWKAEAWSLAIFAYLDSTYEQVSSIIDTSLKQRSLAYPHYLQFDEDEASAQLPVCDGRFEGRKLRYPSSNAYRGLVGSVIAHMETDTSGKVTKAEILSAVPGVGFADGVIKTLSTWTFKPEKGVDRSTCRLNYRNHTYKVFFFIE